MEILFHILLWDFVISRYLTLYWKATQGRFNKLYLERIKFPNGWVLTFLSFVGIPRHKYRQEKTQMCLSYNTFFDVKKYIHTYSDIDELNLLDLYCCVPVCQAQSAGAAEYAEGISAES